MMKWKVQNNEKELSAYRLVLFDLDGTLYEQRPVRVHMALRMMKLCIGQNGGFKELYTILQYRRLREHWRVDDELQNLEKMQYQTLANQLHMPADQIESIVERWMLQEPLELISQYSDNHLLREIKELGKQGVKIVVYSDYPVKDKMKALGIEELDGFCASDVEINSMKPSSKGILYILEKYQIKNEDAVMIGDRMEKDGQAAIGAKIDYRIVYRNRRKRY